MASKLKGSHIIAILITGGVIGWMSQGDIIIGGQAESENATPPPAERAQSTSVVPKVRYTKIIPQERKQILSLRGRTQATAIIQVRSETSGIVENRLVKKGQIVKKGDALCQLETGTRKSVLQQAEAAFKQATADLKANQMLLEQGFATQSSVLRFQTAKDAAKAQLENATQELEKTKIIAKTAGIIQDPVAEIGNLLKAGDICVTIVRSDPMNFIGQVSENKVSSIQVGDYAQINMISETMAEGVIKYISPTADKNTRTFKVEIEIPNKNNALRDGITAQANIMLPSENAFQIQSSWLTLNDDGNIGVRTIDDDNIVRFVPIQILAQTTDGMWIRGITSEQRVITLGQEYVIDGQEVIAVEQTAQNVSANRKLSPDVEKKS